MSETSGKSIRGCRLDITEESRIVNVISFWAIKYQRPVFVPRIWTTDLVFAMETMEVD